MKWKLRCEVNFNVELIEVIIFFKKLRKKWIGKRSNDYYLGIYKMCSNIFTIFSDIVWMT